MGQSRINFRRHYRNFFILFITNNSTPTPRRAVTLSRTMVIKHTAIIKRHHTKIRSIFSHITRILNRRRMDNSQRVNTTRFLRFHTTMTTDTRRRVPTARHTIDNPSSFFDALILPKRRLQLFRGPPTHHFGNRHRARAVVRQVGIRHIQIFSTLGMALHIHPLTGLHNIRMVRFVARVTTRNFSIIFRFNTVIMALSTGHPNKQHTATRHRLNSITSGGLSTFSQRLRRHADLLRARLLTSHTQTFNPTQQSRTTVTPKHTPHRLLHFRGGRTFTTANRFRYNDRTNSANTSSTSITTFIAIRYKPNHTERQNLKMPNHQRKRIRSLESLL